jgi:hypothetical protein
MADIQTTFDCPYCGEEMQGAAASYHLRYICPAAPEPNPLETFSTTDE